MSNPEYVIATEPLNIGVTRAHNRGDYVRSESVEPNGWGAQTARLGTKAANEALADAQGDAPEAPGAA
jgi:hypothetical protein